jgi:uncharacterized protein YjbI with pentapeptide repeats
VNNAKIRQGNDMLMMHKTPLTDRNARYRSMIRRITAIVAGVGLFAAPIDIRSAESDVRSTLESCHGCSFVGRDFRGADLHGISLFATDLRRVNLDGANLSGVHFTAVLLDDANLDNTDLRRASFFSGSLRGVTFAGAKLDRFTSFTALLLQRAQILGDSGPALIRACSVCNLDGLDLSGADLRRYAFTAGSMRHANLRKADLRGTSFWAINLQGSDMSEAQLSGGELVGASLHDVNARGAIFGNVILCMRGTAKHPGDPVDYRPGAVCANLTGTDLTGVDLSQAQSCDNDEVRLTCHSVTRSELINKMHADLTGATAPAL